jgi:hypothetical protein
MTSTGGGPGTFSTVGLLNVSSNNVHGEVRELTEVAQERHQKQLLF